jgi:serine/threonine protein kinase
MGEVYKARDTRLERIVALKVSKTEFSERFDREARAVASLNHSNICTLHDIGPDYLVMEYVEGAPLKGPLPVDQALKYGAQICGALDAAHRKGITHRDLKPANILVAKTGIKLLDFGLAKIGQTATSPGESTVTMALTAKNEIVGTLYYMSPEQLQAQATGQEIDGRSDIFSFGLVFYEMLTGRRAFEGSSPASVIAGIMERPAPSIGDIAPPALDRVLKKCLAKDPDERWQTARDLRDELDWIAGASGEVAPIAARRYWILPWSTTAVLAAVALFGWLRTAQPVAIAPIDAAFSILPPSGKGIAEVGGLSVDRVSPDGSRVLFRAKDNRFYVRRLNSLESEPLPNFTWFGDPFWAPDSQSIAYPTDDARLMKMRIPKGAPEQIANMKGSARGGSWGEKGIILLATSAGLYSIPSGGGTGRPV